MIFRAFRPSSAFLARCTREQRCRSSKRHLRVGARAAPQVYSCCAFVLEFPAWAQRRRGRSTCQWTRATPISCSARWRNRFASIGFCSWSRESSSSCWACWRSLSRRSARRGRYPPIGRQSAAARAGAIGSRALGFVLGRGNRPRRAGPVGDRYPAARHDEDDTLRSDANQLQRALAQSVREHWVLFLVEGIVLVVLGLLAIAIPPLGTTRTIPSDRTPISCSARWRNRFASIGFCSWSRESSSSCWACWRSLSRRSARRGRYPPIGRQSAAARAGAIGSRALGFVLGRGNRPRRAGPVGDRYPAARHDEDDTL